jgi:hypothetical protein
MVMELIRKPLEFEVRQVGEPKDRTLEFIGSTAHVDRYGDIIEVAGWDLKHFKQNPVFMWAHNYNVPPIGKAKKVSKTGDALTFHIYFPTNEEINAEGWPSHIPTPETVYKLIRKTTASKQAGAILDKSSTSFPRSRCRPTPMPSSRTRCRKGSSRKRRLSPSKRRRRIWR